MDKDLLKVYTREKSQTKIILFSRFLKVFRFMEDISRISLLIANNAMHSMAIKSNVVINISWL